ncbi:MAG: hypothetical protein ACXVP7_13400 [Actinomycetota bacterium]
MEPTASDREFTPTLREVQRRRADLHQALIDVEEAISGPAAHRLESWTADVTKQLAALLTTLDEHIEVTERVGGLYDEIQQRAPHLSTPVGRLHDEHPAMRTEALDLLDRFENDPIGDAWTVDQARDDVQRLLGRMVRHRQHGADLVWEAYNLDIGGHE